LAVWLAVSVIPAAWLEVVRLIAGNGFAWGGLFARWAFVACLLAVSWYTQPQSTESGNMLWPRSVVLVAAMGALGAICYLASEATAPAWLVVASIYILLLGTAKGLTSDGTLFWRWGARAAIVILGGAILIALVQLETRFSEEEFFVALQWMALSVFTVLLMLSQTLLTRLQSSPSQRGLRIRRGWLGLAVLATALIGLGVTIRAYQNSFYPSEAPLYEGISAENPFLCGSAPEDPQASAGEEVFQQLLAQVAVNPKAGSPEYGMLAVGTGEQRWADAFHDNILEEAVQGRFTEAAHTVKSAQYEAALRIYYLSAVLEKHPDLFSQDEMELLHAWTADINRRAQTVEMVDWMYGLAFSKWPEGPYENQENGAGLLALLEAGGWAAPELSAANQDYLDRNRRGWTVRFRNTDDAFGYQSEWITNAYYQSLYAGEAHSANLDLSFDWLLLQAPPDGAPLGYNHPNQPSLAGIAYLGARLDEDPSLSWLAVRALEGATAAGKHIAAQPGAEQVVSVVGRAPTIGSCLLYGDSGLPNQVGPLAPDKIVFREGWSQDDAYLLLNLRFTGWHRYKATNTITLAYKGGALVSDVLEGKPFDWLPEGRSVFRDKRIPRENLNGLLVPRRGIDGVLYHLTGFGGPWAQDPPAYAKVKTFETSETLDWSHTQMLDWEGWQHDRWIYLYHQSGPLIIVDRASGPEHSHAALAWHLLGANSAHDARVALQSGSEATEVVFMSKEGSWSDQSSPAGTAGEGFHDMIYYSPTGGQLWTVTVFLMDEWLGAQVDVDHEWSMLEVSQGNARITQQLPDGG
jgi:hypothetical protein